MSKRNNRPEDKRVMLYVPREATEAMNAAIDFVRSNWRKLLRFSLYVLLPVCIVQTVGLIDLVNSAFSQLSTGMRWSSTLSVVCFGLVGFVLLNALLWSLLKLYLSRTDGLDTVTFKELKHLLWPMIWRMTKAVLPIIVLQVPAVLLGMVLMLIFPLMFFALLLFSLPALLIAPVYALEPISLMQAVRRAFGMGWSNLGHLILLSITLAVMLIVLESLGGAPWMLLLAFKETVFTDTAASASPAIMLVVNVLFNLYSVLMCYITYLIQGLMMLTVGYLYGGIIQRNEDRALLTDIDNFENL